jgi:hypothetical protein
VEEVEGHQLLVEVEEVVVRQLQEEEGGEVVVHLLLEVAEAEAVVEGQSRLVLVEVEGEGLEGQNWLVEEAAEEVGCLKLDALEEHGPQVAVAEAEAAEQRLPMEVVE